MNDVRLVATNPDDNTLVPVASNSSGQLAVQSPKIEKVPNDFDVEGDLTVIGNGSFTGGVKSGLGTELGYIQTAGDGKTCGYVFSTDTVNSHSVALNYEDKNSNQVAFIASDVDGNDIARIGWDGDATFMGDIQSTDGTNISSVNSGGTVYVNQKTSNNNASTPAFRAGSTSNGTTVELFTDGKAHFDGDVVVGSRNKKWILTESGGLCHMVEQVSATTADLVDPDLSVDPAFSVPASSDYPKLRDVFAELDVVEKALEQVMEKLKMVEPDGWPVWDGSSNS